MVTPLKRHPGQHGGLIALSLLVVTAIVVWMAHPRRTEPPAEKPRPQASVTQTRLPEHPSLQPIEPASPVELVAVAERELPRQLVATGPISFDENHTSHITAPVAGWLRKNPHGRSVRAGETIGVVYSIEVYGTTRELVDQVRDFRSQAQLDEVRLRLYRWGMRREAVARIEQTLTPQAALPLISRVSGTVVAEKKLANPLVERGDELVTITDPTYAWLYADAPADDAALAHVGMTARVTIEGVARPVTAPIVYISRRVTDGKRQVRFDLHTAALRMPPTMHAKAELSLPAAHGPAIPDSAIIRDGDHAFVYVAHGTRMEPREVTLGSGKDGLVLVMSGLAAGETIARDRDQLR